jgi:ribokinase
MSGIAVLGSANMDLVVRQARRAEPGETIFGSSFHTGPGGKGLNQAVAAARAGATVAFIGAVGADDFGVRLRSWLSAEGIDVGRVRIVDEPTGIAQITVTDDGENSIVVVAGANARSVLDDADRETIAAASHLVVQLERPESLLLEALAHARAHGVTTVVTPAPAHEGLDDIVRLADVLVPNEGEAMLLSGEADAESAAVALSRLAGTVVLTRGRHGAIVARDGAVVTTVAAVATDVVDTTGAGDTFTGVLVAGLAAGDALDRALEAAAAAAAIAVSRRGAAEAMPTADEIAARLARRGDAAASTPTDHPAPQETA